MRLTRYGWFAIWLVWASAAASLLGNGITHHMLALIIAGATLSTVCPWGVAIAWLIHHLERRP